MAQADHSNSTPQAIIARTGNVLYWLGCLLAAAIFLMYGSIGIQGGGYHFEDWLAVTALALIPWLIGRACRYVLAGK